MAKTSTAQDAIRLLYIFVNGCDPLENHYLGYVGCFEGKARLHALDFWVRYPDYLAFELLNKYEDNLDIGVLNRAQEILATEEPDLRAIPMIRYRFGAYDDISEALSILISKGLIITGGDKIDGKITAYDYYVTSQASELIKSISEDFPILKWFDDRTQLVKEIAGNQGGAALKAIQYKHMSYAQTTLGTLIPSIKEEVLSRLNEIMAKQ